MLLKELEIFIINIEFCVIIYNKFSGHLKGQTDFIYKELFVSVCFISILIQNLFYNKT